MLLHQGTNKVAPNGIATLEKAKSLVSHKSTPELWTHIDTGWNVTFLLGKSVDGVSSELVTFGELKVKSEGITTNPQRPHSPLWSAGKGWRTCLIMDWGEGRGLLWA